MRKINCPPHEAYFVRNGLCTPSCSVSIAQCLLHKEFWTGMCREFPSIRGCSRCIVVRSVCGASKSPPWGVVYTPFLRVRICVVGHSPSFWPAASLKKGGGVWIVVLLCPTAVASGGARGTFRAPGEGSIVDVATCVCACTPLSNGSGGLFAPACSGKGVTGVSPCVRMARCGVPERASLRSAPGGVCWVGISLFAFRGWDVLGPATVAAGGGEKVRDLEGDQSLYERSWN